MGKESDYAIVGPNGERLGLSWGKFTAYSQIGAKQYRKNIYEKDIISDIPHVVTIRANI